MSVVILGFIIFMLARAIGVLSQKDDFGQGELRT